MPFATTSDQDNALDAVVASWAADAATWRIYSGVPNGNELPATGGYAPVAYTGSEWAAAASGIKAASVSFGTSTGAFGDTGFYWAICDAAGAPIFWDELPQALSVTAAGTPVSVAPVLFFRSEF